MASGEDARVLTVLTLIRSPQAAPFGDVERRRIDWTARLLAPVLARLAYDRELEARAAERHTAIREDMAQLFRGEALEQYQRGSTDEGHLLEIEPGWMRRAYVVILALLGAALLFSALVHIDRYAEGVGVIGLRFTRDPFCFSERFDTLRRELGPGFIAVELDSSPGNPYGHPRNAHSVLTEHLDDREGTPTRAALDQVLDFFKERLHLS